MSPWVYSRYINNAGTNNTTQVIASLLLASFYISETVKYTCCLHFNSGSILLKMTETRDDVTKTMRLSIRELQMTCDRSSHTQRVQYTAYRILPSVLCPLEIVREGKHLWKCGTPQWKSNVALITRNVHVFEI
jgi:hypothetical protein